MDVLLGLQWGDEGKGKVVDFLAPKYDIVARFQGGPNAGHTLVFGGKKYVLHQIPSGIFQPQTENLIGNGVVLDPIILKREIENLKVNGYDVAPKLFVSKKAHLILPTHRQLDAASESSKGDSKIGSTLKGIGPVYQDKIGRSGIRVGDILSANFEAKYKETCERHRHILSQYGLSYDGGENDADFWDAIAYLRGLQLVDSDYWINSRIKAGKTVIAEGAQGSLLDVDFGSYPFVTSSNTTCAGACTGLGVAPGQVAHVFGIFKAYCTRVGSGPFPTELNDATGENLRKIGHEFGATTGRPRRCGWLDLPALKYTVILNGVTELFMMKADVLNSFEEIKVCTSYQLPDGSTTDQMPYDLLQTPVKPVYRSFAGWGAELATGKSLPKALNDYIAFIESYLGVPIGIVSVGPGREETIWRR